MPDRPILVTGATGLHGGAVCRGLLASGRPVRALTRDLDGARARQLAELGAELVVGDLLVTESLLAATQDVCAVYAVTTPFGADPRAEVAQGENIIAAAREAEVPWLILASVASADRSTGIPHFESKARIEQQLGAHSIPYTIVAPTYFYENLGDLDEIITSGQLALAARSGDIAAMYRYLEQTGYQVNISDLHRRFPEVAWTSFADWTQQRITAR
jgi:uncharacterized protein YbjT (DUF2867 family)